MAIQIDGDGIPLASLAPAAQVSLKSGRKNLIINGGMDVWQRGTSFTATGAYTADRFKAQWSGAAGTMSKVTSGLPAGSRSAASMTATGTSGWCQFGTQIEYKNFFHAVGQQVTISYYAKANNTNAASTSLNIRTRTNTTEDAVTVFSGANTDSSQTITTTWTKYTATRTIPSDSKAWSVEFWTGNSVAGDGFEITQIQLELGDTATDFEHRSYGEELVLCQRYFNRYNGSTSLGTFGGRSSTLFTGSLTLPTMMRTIPSLSFSGIIDVLGIGESKASNTITMAATSNSHSLEVNVTTTGSGSVGFGGSVRIEAGGYLDIDAEL